MATPMNISSEGGCGGQYSPPPLTSSFRHMLKSSVCCFTPAGHLPHEILHPDDGDYSDCNSQPASSIPSWINVHLEIRDRWFAFGRRSASGGGRNRRCYRSEDFRYDPESYSLNFEDGARREDELAIGSFAGCRLPAATPDRVSAGGRWSDKASSAVGARRREIAAWS